MAGAVVRLGGITFNSGPDGDGDDFIVSDLDGWDGGGVELGQVEKPLGDGAVIVYGRRTAWTLTLSGWVVAGPEGIGPARRKLTAALYALVELADTLEVDEEDGTYGLDVRLSGNLRTRQQGPDAISFEVALVAPIPTKALIGS